MNEQIKIFESPQFGQIRTAGTTDEPLFCAADVCKALGYSNNRDALARHVDEADVVKHDVGVITGKKADGTDAVQQVSTAFVNESGLYTLIFGSNLKAAKEFKHWVTSEVLPTIRNAEHDAENEQIQIFE
ncbi:MAG: Bro-N domain-containing protein, partial [Alphaproteobacteria bacterium]|nr:Bro-N domain-containing protein [Alphaproteobacteria bacterium]